MRTKNINIEEVKKSKYITKTPKYDSQRDIAKTSPFGYVNLYKAFESGYITGDLGNVDVDFNGIEDPSAIMDRALDIFDLYRQGNYVNSVSEQSSKTNSSLE